MMVQMFGTMHRDQMEVIRAELDQLHELTEEFHALKNELAERTRERAEIPLQEPEVNSAGLIGRPLWGQRFRQQRRRLRLPSRRDLQGLVASIRHCRIRLRQPHPRQWDNSRPQNPIFYQPNLRRVQSASLRFLNQSRRLVRPPRLPSPVVQAQRLIKTETPCSGSISESWFFSANERPAGRKSSNWCLACPRRNHGDQSWRW